MTSNRPSLSKFYHLFVAGILTTSLLGCNEEYDNTARDTGYVADTDQPTDTTHDTDQDTDTSDTSGNTPETCPAQCAENQFCFATKCVDSIILALGDEHSCALLPDNTVKCWGANQLAQLGQGNVNDQSQSTPLAVAFEVAGSTGVGKLSGIYARVHQTCVTTESATGDKVWCWGKHHAVPTGTSGIVTSPGLIAGASLANSQIRQLALGDSHSCSLYSDGDVRCWGAKNYGQLGSGAPQNNNPLTPVKIASLLPAAQITAGSDFTCALTGKEPRNDVYCWGRNDTAQLAQTNDPTTDSPTPLKILGLEHGVISVQAGAQHACAILSDGKKSIECWGLNTDGQLGTENFFPVPIPQAPSNGLSGVQQLALGTSFTCALLDSGQVTCTGSNFSGQLGRPNADDPKKHSTFEVIKNLNNVHRIFAGATHMCAVHGNNEVSCWGNNEKGQIGPGTSAAIYAPAKVSFE